MAYQEALSNFEWSEFSEAHYPRPRTAVVSSFVLLIPSTA
jgi:hypothetical protein